MTTLTALGLAVAAPTIPAPNAAAGGADGTSPSHHGRVGRWVDGDTLELRSGVQVRLIGIDTPERGECGYDTATNTANNLAPRGTEVTLVNPTAVPNTDRHGRLLRYVVRAGNDVGLRQIKRGAKARYDSRDGYDPHPREDLYRRTDGSRPDYPRTCDDDGNGGSQDCYNYSRCVPSRSIRDLDCSDLRAPITVRHRDPHAFDTDDADRIGCETGPWPGQY